MTSIKQLIAFIILAAFLAGAYVLVVTYGVFDTAAKLGEYEEKVSTVEKDVIIRLQRISDVTIDTTLFSSKEYQSLKDTRVMLPLPELYRKDPFVRP